MSAAVSKSEDCIFCKVIDGSIPSEKVFENDRVFAFKDIEPQAPVHVLIVPKIHIQSVAHVPKENGSIFQDLFFASQIIAKDMGIERSGFRTVFNSGNHACQTVHHIHLHLLGGTQLGGSMV